MAPSKSEQEYAEEQVHEANRRLAGIRQRVERKVHRFRIANPGGEITVAEFHGSLEDDDALQGQIDDHLQKPRDEYEEEVETNVDEKLLNSHIQNVVINCQLCIELSAKAMFKLVGMDHPFSHGISFGDGRTQGFYSKVPNDFERRSEVVRVIFLTKFWGEFYELAKYGAPQLNVRPEMIFESSDGARAVEDATFCVELAQDLLEFVKSSNA